MVYLEGEQLRALKDEARARGISLAELIRRVVRDHLEKEPPLTPVPSEVHLKIVALGRSGVTDISERHDAYLGAAVRDEHSR